MANNRASGGDGTGNGAAKTGMVGGSGRVWHILSVKDLPFVPSDKEEVLAEGAHVLRRFPEASYAEGVNGLREVAARGKSHPGELGDLAPPVERSENCANVLEQGRAIVTRLEELLAYHKAALASEEHTGNILIDGYEEEATRRIEKGRIPAEAYENLRKFVDARGEAISRGKAQAKAVQEARNAAKAPADERRDP